MAIFGILLKLFSWLLNKDYIVQNAYLHEISSSSSSCRAGSTDILVPLSPLFPIVHRPRQVFRTTSRYPLIVAECMFVLVVLLLHGHVLGSIRVHHLWVRPCFYRQCPACLVRLTWIVFVIGMQLAVQLVSCGVMSPGLVQDCSQHSCVIAV